MTSPRCCKASGKPWWIRSSLLNIGGAVWLHRILYRLRFLQRDRVTASTWKERERKWRSQATEVKIIPREVAQAAFSQLCLSKCRHVCMAQRSLQFSACPEHGGLDYTTRIAGGTSAVAFWQGRNHDANWEWALCQPPKWHQLHYGLGKPDYSFLWIP